MGLAVLVLYEYNELVEYVDNLSYRKNNRLNNYYLDLDSWHLPP